jgi:hypothetical protein
MGQKISVVSFREKRNTFFCWKDERNRFRYGLERFLIVELRNRRATTRRSPLALIPLEKILTSSDCILVLPPKSSTADAQSDEPGEQTRTNPVAISLQQRRPGPDAPPWKIPVSEWPNIVRRVVEEREPLRTVASDYGVSYETIRRTVKAAQRLP